MASSSLSSFRVDDPTTLQSALLAQLIATLHIAGALGKVKPLNAPLIVSKYYIFIVIMIMILFIIVRCLSGVGCWITRRGVV